MVKPYRNIRSIMETPVMDEKKWAKVPHIEADAFLLDLEDSAHPGLKAEARERVAQCVRDPRYLGGRIALPRVNNLDTPWGFDDLVALARAGTDVLAYPKIRSAGELSVVQQILWDNDCDPDLFVVVESARAVLEISDIARHERLRGILFGPSDLALEVGFELYDGAHMSAASLGVPRSAITLAGAAHGLAVYDVPFVSDLRDDRLVSEAVQRSVREGFSGLLTFYPPHVPVINEGFSVPEDRVREARTIVEMYEEGFKRNQTAVLWDGRALIPQDYKRAKALLARHAR